MKTNYQKAKEGDGVRVGKEDCEKGGFKAKGRDHFYFIFYILHYNKLQ